MSLLGTCGNEGDRYEDSRQRQRRMSRPLILLAQIVCARTIMVLS